MYNSTPMPTGWVCPKCGRVYSPTQEMCLYCGGNSNTGSNNFQTSGANTLGALIYDGEAPKVTLATDKTCSFYTKEGYCIGVKEPFKPECNGELSKCSEYTNK